jgi:hypothetical protein
VIVLRQGEEKFKNRKTSPEILALKTMKKGISHLEMEEICDANEFSVPSQKKSYSKNRFIKGFSQKKIRFSTTVTEIEN